MTNEMLDRGIKYLKGNPAIHKNGWNKELIGLLETMKEPEEKKEKVYGMEMIEGKIMVFTDNGIYTPEGDKIYKGLKLKVLADKEEKKDYTLSSGKSLGEVFPDPLNNIHFFSNFYSFTSIYKLNNFLHLFLSTHISPCYTAEKERYE